MPSLDYARPRNRSDPRQTGVGIALWIVIALILTAALFAIYLSEDVATAGL